MIDVDVSADVKPEEPVMEISSSQLKQAWAQQKQGSGMNFGSMSNDDLARAIAFFVAYKAEQPTHLLPRELVEEATAAADDGEEGGVKRARVA